MSGHQINIRFDETTVTNLDRLGKMMDRPRAWLVQMAVRELLEREMWHVLALEKSEEDIAAGRVRTLEEVMADLRQQFGQNQAEAA
jgi:predicted transcriptional regulator